MDQKFLLEEAPRSERSDTFSLPSGLNSARPDDEPELNENLENALDSLDKVGYERDQRKDLLPTDSEIKSFSNELNKSKAHESQTEKALALSALPKDLSNTFKLVNARIAANPDTVVEQEMSERSSRDLLTSYAKTKSPVTSTKEKNVLGSGFSKSKIAMQVNLPSETLDSRP